MSLALQVLKELWDTSLPYKGIRVNLFGVPKFKNKSDATIRATLSYIKGEGLVENLNNQWHITQKGRKFAQKKFDSLKNFQSSFKKDSPKNLIVMFDIPENRRGERDWFRWHLKKFNYVMIQKSVWVGPSPLPLAFTDYVEKIKLKSALKMFKLAKPYKPGAYNVNTSHDREVY